MEHSPAEIVCSDCESVNVTCISDNGYRIGNMEIVWYIYCDKSKYKSQNINCIRLQIVFNKLGDKQ